MTSTLTTEESSHCTSSARKAMLRELASTVDGRVIVSAMLAPSSRMLALPARGASVEAEYTTGTAGTK